MSIDKLKDIKEINTIDILKSNKDLSDNKDELYKLANTIENDQIRQFIKTIPILDNNDIKNKNGLVRSCIQLDMLIGHERLKDDVIKQLKRIIVSKRRNDTEKKMMSIVLYGPPGVGKTEIGKILAKILLSIGYTGDKIITTKPIGGELMNGLGDTTGMLINLLFLVSVISLAFDILSKFISYIRSIIKFSRKLSRTMNIYLLCVAIIFGYIIYRYCIRPYLRKIVTNSSGIDINDIDKSFKIAKRNDLIAGYLGQTESKTMNFLLENQGKVIFFDEAYSLSTGSDLTPDLFAEVALNTINQFMSENPGTIIIFAGYKEKMEKTIFKQQEGLLRRCLFHLDCDPYDHKELYKIFHLQMRRSNCKFKNKKARLTAKNLIKDNYKYFKQNGGDTERLLTHCITSYNDSDYINLISRIIKKDSNINLPIIKLNVKDIKFGIRKFIHNYREPAVEKGNDGLSGLLSHLQPKAAV